MWLLFSFVVGLGLLSWGAEWLVRGSARLALSLGIPPLVIGLTVVSWGTSAPEVAVSVKAALEDSAALAVGNVIGSNLFNTLFILGLSSVIIPLAVSRGILKLDLPFMVLLTLLVYYFCLYDGLTRPEGIILIVLMVVYTAWQFLGPTRGEPDPDVDLSEAPRGWKMVTVNLGLVIVGLVMLAVGARLLVKAAVEVAVLAGVSEVVIGLTIVAAGTSLPEVAASVVAALRGERDIAVGNVVGSNIFNLAGVLGVCAAVTPAPVPIDPEILLFDLPFLVVIMLACVPLFYSHETLTRLEGIVMLLIWGTYTTIVVFNAIHSPNVWMLELFGGGLLLIGALLIYFESLQRGPFGGLIRRRKKQSKPESATSVE
jgi:cation:H+ antiporter